MCLAYSFEEIMAYHPDNKYVYREIKENLPNLVPFVGAGLTQFAYPSWKQALIELAGKITNRNYFRQVENLIKNGYYMGAAQRLEDLRTPSNLARDIANLFSSDHLTDKMSIISKQAVYMLPWLFHGLVLTTNFDETLETVYGECDCLFETVSHPGHPVLEQFIRNPKHHGLFKMHGTVIGNLIEYENIVFTSAQYDRHYGKDSPLIHDLKACFGKRIMFFLGCSLEKDRTMDILHDSIIQGVNHYAVIGCQESEKDEKVRRLGEKNIRVILYKQGRHEAVRVILEHLLEETNPDLYRKINPIAAMKPGSFLEQFSPDAGIVPLSGRKKEMGELNSFLRTSGGLFQWWAIVGPGGCGKSRLAYEFQNQLPPGWIVHKLKRNDYKNLNGVTERLTQKTLLIADYVQEHARELGEWMESLNENEQLRSQPIRLLLVERDTDRGLEDFLCPVVDYVQEHAAEIVKRMESFSEKPIQLLPAAREADREPEDSAWTKQLYSNVRNEMKLKEACYRESFLKLSPLSDENLMDIMENYARILQWDKKKSGRVLEDKTRQILLQKLKMIDPYLCRPLYAMFLTVAYIEYKDIEQWKRNDMLNYVIGGEGKRIKFSIKNVMCKDTVDKIYNACIYLKCAATALQGIPVENLQKLFPDIWKIIKDKSKDFESPEDFLYQTGLTFKDKLTALRPDVVGEYFVCRWLFKQNEKTIHDFVAAIWKEPVPAIIFFDRLICNFGHLLNENPERWDRLYSDRILLPENALKYYPQHVLNATYYCNSAVQCEKLVYLLEIFANKYPDDSKIAFAFAGGLFNLSNKQDRRYAESTIGRLEKFSADNPDVIEIAVELAKALFNLSNKQDVLSAEGSIARLEKICAGYPDVTEIVILFAKGLFNLSCEQDGQDEERNITRLEKLCARYPNVTEIAAEFAKGLYNHSIKQDERGAERSIVYLEKLCAAHPGVIEIVVHFAKALVNLSNKQDMQGAGQTVRRLEKLCTEHPDMAELEILFAKGLYNLSIRQDTQGVKRTAECLKELYIKHPDTEIAAVFAGVMVNLSSKQDEQGAERIARCLKKLYAEHSNTEIAVKFAKVLFNLSIRQDRQGVERTAECLEKLWAEHPDVIEIAVLFAKMLVNLSSKQDEQGVERTVRRLEKLCKAHSDVTEIEAEFAKGLFNLSGVQNGQAAERTMERLRMILMQNQNVYSCFNMAIQKLLSENQCG